MVLCQQVSSHTDPCEDINPCECAEIIGRDHLKAKRARKFRCRSKRIRRLAQPRILTRKYCEDETRNGKAAVEIIRTFEEQTPVRIKLLAYPNVRRMVSSRDAYKGMIDKEWYDRFENLIRRSMLTMYSRLANVQLPNKTTRKKWTREDWQRQCEWLKIRAIPKMQKSSPTPKRKTVPISNLITSIFMLSRPRQPRKKYRPYCGYESPVKDTALSYQPSDRILKLAAPKHPKNEDEDEEEFEPFQVNPRALKFQPSERLKKLAIPKPSPKADDDSKYTPSGVFKRALKATINPRVLELSKPKDREDEEEEKPLVNPKALKAKPTPRILELAKPKVFVNA